MVSKYPDEYRLEAQKLWIRRCKTKEILHNLKKKYPGMPLPSERTINNWSKHWKKEGISNYTRKLNHLGGKSAALTQKKNEALELQTDCLNDMNRVMVEFTSKVREYIGRVEDMMDGLDPDKTGTFLDGIKVLKDLQVAAIREQRETNAMLLKYSGLEPPQKSINLNVNTDYKSLEDKMKGYDKEGLFE